MREELTTAEVAERNQRGYSYQRGKPVWKTRPVCRGGCRACVSGAGRCVTDVQHRNECIAECGFGKLSSAQDGATCSGKWDRGFRKKVKNTVRVQRVQSAILRCLSGQVRYSARRNSIV